MNIEFDSDVKNVNWQRASELFSITTLTTAVGKEQFYKKQGWFKQTTSFIWPRSEKQKKENT